MQPNKKVLNLDEPKKMHLRKKTCVVCMARWTIEWRDDESFVEYITCPNHRSKEKR